MFELLWLKVTIKGMISIFGLLFSPFYQWNLIEHENPQNQPIKTITGGAEMCSGSNVLMGDNNGFGSQMLLKLTKLELLHPNTTRSTNMSGKNLTSDRSLIDRKPDTSIPVVKRIY